MSSRYESRLTLANGAACQKRAQQYLRSNRTGFRFQASAQHNWYAVHVIADRLVFFFFFFFLTTFKRHDLVDIILSRYRVFLLISLDLWSVIDWNVYQIHASFAGHFIHFIGVEKRESDEMQRELTIQTVFLIFWNVKFLTFLRVTFH